MAGPLGKLTAVLGLDAREFSSGIDSAKKDVAGFGMNAQTGFKVAGAAATVGFGLMTKGALEMESAQGKFQAATGASAEEAQQFAHEMNSLSGTAAATGKSFEEIAGAGITVSKQFDVTGEQARDLTEDVLAFSKVTGQDASEAAGALEDALSAFGLGAEDAAGMMDVLVASNQKFGTDVGPETLDQLKKMAPALQAMGVGAEEAVGFLNLFEGAGLDAAGAMKGFNAAIDAIPPGQSLEDVLKKIQAIEDPLKRAQYAADIFGAKAGSGLANALKPGGLALDDYILTTEDAAGTTDKAAEDMLTTTDKFRMFAEKLGGFLRDAGQTFGPFVTGLAAIAPLVGTQMGGVLDKVRSTGVWKAAADKLGLAVGAAQALAHQAAATGTAAVSAMATKIAAMSIPLAPAGTTVGTAVGAAMGLGMLLGLGAAGLAGVTAPIWINEFLGGPGTKKHFHDLAYGAALEYAKGYDESIRTEFANVSAAAFDAALASGSSVDAAIRAGETAGLAYLTGFPKPITPAALESELGQRLMGLSTIFERVGGESGAALVDGAAQGARDASPEFADGFGAVLDAGGQAFRQSYHAFVDMGKETVAALGQGMSNAEATHGLMNDINTLKDALETYLSPRQQAIELIGSDYIKTLTTGMNSQDEDLRTAAQNLAIGAINTIEDAGLTGKKGQKGLKDIGILYDQLLASGMTVAEARVELAAGGVGQATIDTLTGYAPKAGNAATAYINHFNAALREGKSDVLRTLQTVFGGAMRGQSPPKEGPIRDAILSAPKVAQAYVQAFNSGLGGLFNGVTTTPAFAGGSAFPLAAGGDSGGINFESVVVNVSGGNGTPQEIQEATERGMLKVMEKVARLRLTMTPDVSGRPI